MADKTYRTIASGFLADNPDLPKIKKMYQIKYGYYVLSWLVLILTGISFYIVKDLKETGAFFNNLTIDRTIITWYVVGLAIITAALRLRACFCVVCSGFRWPTKLDFESYCDVCGAHLYKYTIFEQQNVAQSKHNLSLNDRTLEMVKRGDVDAIRMLLYKGADVNHTDRFGNTALMTAAMTNRIEVMDLLIDYLADLNLQNNFGLTALMMAVDKRKIEAASRLLEKGAKLTLVAQDGRKVRDIARNSKDEPMIDLLSRY